MSKLTPDGLLLTEQAILKVRMQLLDAQSPQVPFESLRRSLRTSQKLVERDLAAAQSIANDAATRETPMSNEEALATVDGLLTKMRGLKRKFTEVSTSTAANVNSARERINHVNLTSSFDNTDSPRYAPWARKRLARELVDYLLRHDPPMPETARQLAEAEHIEEFVHSDIELFEDLRRIEQSLADGRANEALSWCRDNATALKKSKSTLEFELRFQEYIELVRNGKHTEAIAYGRKYLVSWGETHLAEIKQAMGLLAFAPDTSYPIYRRLYDKARWTRLQKLFRSTLFTLHSLPPLPTLNLVLHAGLASLKLPICFSDESGAHNPDCPVCDTHGLGALAVLPEVPYAHHVNSVLVCHITGKLMEGGAEGLDPLTLPNGRVYSREALEAMALANGGEITCPRTGDKFTMLETKKVFIS